MLNKSCPYIFKKGKRKGEVCGGSKAKGGRTYCSRHKKYETEGGDKKRTRKKDVSESKAVVTHSRRSMGASSALRGKEYEVRVHRIIKSCILDGEPLTVQDEKNVGGSSSKRDLVCAGDNGIEVKRNLSGADFIQLVVRWDSDSCTWKGPRRTRASHPLEIVEKYLVIITKEHEKKPLFYGMIPPLGINNRKEYIVWDKKYSDKRKEDGKKGKDYTFDVDDTFIRVNYSIKGNSYIQIKDYGLYHLGNDVYNFGVPEFKPSKSWIRLRCKFHKGNIPSSLTMSAKCKGLERSPYSLDDLSKLPPNLMVRE